MGKYVSEKPAIGIRPIVDGREGPMQLRASLEPQVTAMANAAKKLFEENLRYSDGTPVRVVAPEIATVSNINVNDVILNGIRVFISNLNRKEAVSAVSVKGLGDGNPVNNLSLKNITLKYRSSTPYHIIGLDN